MTAIDFSNVNEINVGGKNVAVVYLGTQQLWPLGDVLMIDLNSNDMDAIGRAINAYTTPPPTQTLTTSHIGPNGKPINYIQFTQFNDPDDFWRNTFDVSAIWIGLRSSPDTTWGFDSDLSDTSGKNHAQSRSADNWVFAKPAYAGLQLTLSIGQEPGFGGNNDLLYINFT